MNISETWLKSLEEKEQSRIQRKMEMVPQKTEEKKTLKAFSKGRFIMKERKFVESVELSITLKDNAEFNGYVQLHNGRSKPAKICLLLSNGICGRIVQSNEKWLHDNIMIISMKALQHYADKHKGRKLAREYDFFISDKEAMPIVAKTIGKWLGVIGKMPSIKAGHVVANEKELKGLVEGLRNTIHIKSKDSVIGCAIGRTSMSIGEISENLANVIAVIPPYKKLIIKQTMGMPKLDLTDLDFGNKDGILT